jgi:hypothetical protein
MVLASFVLPSFSQLPASLAARADVHATAEPDANFSYEQR